MKRAQRDAYCGGPPTWYQRILSMLASVLLLGLLVYLAVIYPTLPESIPTHFDFAGNPTGWGSRATVWLLPGIGAVTDLTIWLMDFFPQSWSLGVPVTVFNRSLVFRLARDMMAEMRFAMALVWVGFGMSFLYGQTKWMGWLAAALVVFMLVPIVKYFVRLAICRRQGRI